MYRIAACTGHVYLQSFLVLMMTAVRVVIHLHGACCTCHQLTSMSNPSQCLGHHS